MRSFVFLLIALSSFLTKAQDSNLTKEYLFCGVEVLVPPDCQIKETYTTYNGNKQSSGYVIKQGNQFIQWTYYNHIPDQVKGEYAEQMLGHFLPQKEKKLVGKPKKFISLDQTLDGWLIEKKYREINKCFLFASGVINKEHVIIYCGLMQKPKNNKSIPDFMSQIIRFK